MTSTDQDRICASLARSSLFPKRMHRDSADDSHFPALLQLDLLRDSCLQSLTNATISSVFPRHVVVVRNLADGGMQWNGEPDFDTPASVSFSVIPNYVSVRCTSDCDKYLTSKSQRAFQQQSHDKILGGASTEIVLCSDRILKKDSLDASYKGVAKELPPKSFQAVEEVLAHELVKVRLNSKNSSSSDNLEKANVQVEAARAAECYFSRHNYDDKKQIKKGSRLQTGYSWLPAYLQGWSMSKCLSAVATEHLVADSMSQYDAKEAVQAAMKHQSQ